MKHKSCSGCKALVKGTGYYCCKLKYQIEIKLDSTEVLMNIEPLEQCPKPLTEGDLYLAFQTPRLRKINV
jgi:hypothetical protein